MCTSAYCCLNNCTLLSKTSGMHFLSVFAGKNERHAPGCIKLCKIKWNFLQPFPLFWRIFPRAIIDKSGKDGLKRTGKTTWYCEKIHSNAESICRKSKLLYATGPGVLVRLDYTLTHMYLYSNFGLKDRIHQTTCMRSARWRITRSLDWGLLCFYCPPSHNNKDDLKILATPTLPHFQLSQELSSLKKKETHRSRSVHKYRMPIKTNCKSYDLLS